MSKVNWKTVIEELMIAGFTQKFIGDYCNGNTQGWVSHIKNGIISCPSYDDGILLLALHKKARKKITASVVDTATTSAKA